MSIAKKINQGDFLPGTGSGRFPVYSKQFNALVDVVNELEPADGTLEADVIQESTSAAGVTVDGLLIKDGGLSPTDLVDLSGSTAGIKLSANVTEFVKEVTIASANIVGTSAGDLGHSAGAILVAAPSSDYALEFVSATLIYDFATAAYTGGAGDDLVVRIGTTTVSPAVATADLITAAGDQVVHLRALSAADYDLPVGSTINLKCTEVTQPGTAAGVIRAIVTYRQITTNL